MNWRIDFTDTARKQFFRIPRKDSDRIQIAIDEMAINPFKGDIVKMEGTGNRWRRRIGSYRVMYNLLPKEGRIFIYDIRRRTSKTY